MKRILALQLELIIRLANDISHLTEPKEIEKVKLIKNDLRRRKLYALGAELFMDRDLIKRAEEKLGRATTKKANHLLEMVFPKKEEKP